MEKLGILGDLHITRYADMWYLEYQLKILDVAFKDFKEKGITKVVLLGDVFENRTTYNIFLVNSFKNYVEQKIEEGFEFYVLVGNHDVFMKTENTVNSVSLIFKDTKGFNLISTTEPMDIEIYGKNFLFCSWIPEINNEVHLQKISESKSDFMFGHLELNGFRMEGRNVAKSGMDRNILSKFKKVITGHYHDYSEKDNIVYAGCPYQTKWGEMEKKYYWTFDCNTEVLEKTELPFYLYYTITDLVNCNPMDYQGKIVKIFVEGNMTPEMEAKFNAVVSVVAKYDIFDITKEDKEVAEIQEADVHIDENSILVTIIDAFKFSRKDELIQLFNETKDTVVKEMSVMDV